MSSLIALQRLGLGYHAFWGLLPLRKSFGKSVNLGAVSVLSGIESFRGIGLVIGIVCCGIRTYDLFWGGIGVWVE